MVTFFPHLHAYEGVGLSVLGTLWFGKHEVSLYFADIQGLSAKYLKVGREAGGVCIGRLCLGSSSIGVTLA